MPYNELISVDLSGPFWDKGGWYKQDWEQPLTQDRGSVQSQF